MNRFKSYLKKQIKTLGSKLYLKLRWVIRESLSMFFNAITKDVRFSILLLFKLTVKLVLIILLLIFMLIIHVILFIFIIELQNFVSDLPSIVLTNINNDKMELLITSILFFSVSMLMVSYNAYLAGSPKKL